MKKLLTKTTKLVEDHTPTSSPPNSNPQKSAQPPEQLTNSKNSAITATQPNSLIGKTCKLQSHTVTIDEVIAEGGFGVVFLAKNNKKEFAFKRIVVNNEADFVVAEREIQFLATLTTKQNPHLLPLLDYQINKLTTDITEIISLTPFCKSSLLNVLNKAVAAKTTLSPPAILRTLSQIILGVETMHSFSPNPIIHRDLKVENILENGSTFIICDFGSATNKVWDPEVHSILSIQEDLEKYTTLAYRAPEMVDLYSGRGPITTKSDIWAVGVLVYKMCYFTTPFGDSILAIQNAKKLDFPLQPAYPLELQLLINYMLLPDQTNRPDIAQLSELVHAMLEVPNPLGKPEKRPWTFQEISDHFKNLATETNQSDAGGTSGAGGGSKKMAAVVLETSVTPRQRPKANNASVAVVDIIPAKVVAIIPPPKSPKPERKLASEGEGSQTSSPFPTATTDDSLPPVVASWNPFETDTFTATTTTTSTDPTDDPFANAPFDFLKYGTDCRADDSLMDVAGVSSLNPFLTPEPIVLSKMENAEFENNVVVVPKKPKGVTNYSFED